MDDKDDVLAMAIELAIHNKDRDLLLAVLALGFNPKISSYERGLSENSIEMSPIEQARLENWDEGLALLETLH